MVPSFSKQVLLSIVVLLAFTCSISYSQRCSTKSDIVFVVDQSGSIRDQNPRNGSWDNWELIKDFIIEVIRNSNVSYDGIHFGLVTFGNIGVERFYLLDHLDVQSLITAVRELPPGQGQTNLYAGLNLARTSILSPNNGARLDVSRIVIVITDGKANINTAQTIPEAVLLHNADVRVFAVGITGSIDEEQIKAVSSPPHQKNAQYWTTPDFTSLYSIVQSLQNATCDPPKQIFNDCRAIDVCFAVDVPQTSTDFVVVKSFIKRFIQQYLLIGADTVRVCFITFDNRQASVRIRLNQYYNEDDLRMAIDAIPFTASNNGDPTYALLTAANTAFTPTSGARGSSFKPTLVTLLNNALPNRASAIDAFNTLRQRGIRSIAVGMTFDISINELGVITYVNNDVISSTSYDQLASKVQPLSSVLCGNGEYEACPIKADICLLLDQSTSIVSAPGGYDNWLVHILGFAKSVAGSFPIGTDDTRVGVVKFSSGAQVAFGLTQYTTRNDLVNAIDQLQIQGGETNIAAGIRTCRNEILSTSRGGRPNVPKFVILITDGKANVEAGQTLTEANLTKGAPATIFAVGITNNVDSDQLRQICSFPPETHFFYVSDFSKLNTILNDLVQRSCIGQSTIPPSPGTSITTTSGTTTWLPSPTSSSASSSTSTSPSTSVSTSASSSASSSPSSPSSSATTTSVSTFPLTNTTTTVIATSTSRITTVCTSVTVPISTSPGPSSSRTPAPWPSTATAPPGTICPSIADVVLILDQSTSIVYARGEYDNWYKYILGFATGIVDSFDIGPTKTQVGVVKFSESAEPSIYLYDYKDKASLKAAIQALDINGGETNIAAACRMTRVNMFNARYGARQGVPRIVILLTDGEANREKNLTLPEADLLKATGAQVFTVGITDRTDIGQLRSICSQPSETHYFYVDDYSQLNTIQNAVIARACNQIPDPGATQTTTLPSSSTSRPSSSLSPSSSSSTTTRTVPSTSSATTRASSTASTSRASSSSSSTTTARPASSSTSRPNSVASATSTLTPITTGCAAVADVVVILDQSTSIVYAEGGYSNWYDHILGFAKNLSSSFVISPTNTQVAAVKFSGAYTIAFYLNDYDTVPEVVSALNSLEIEGGETNIAAALRVARTTVCTAAHGHRANAKCAIVLLTDGEANRETNMTLPEADRCKQDGIEIFTLGVTKRVNPIQLQSIASLPVSTHYYYVDDYKQLSNVVGSISKNVCDALRAPRGT